MTRKRHDFQGVPFLVNYADQPPYCIVDKQENNINKVSGVFLDVLRIALQYLNATLVLRESNQENRNIWHKRYLLYKNNIILLMSQKTKFHL